MQCSIVNQSTEEIDRSFVVHLRESKLTKSAPSSPCGRVVSADREQVFRTFVTALQNKFLQIRGAGPIGVVTVVRMVAATPRAAPSQPQPQSQSPPHVTPRRPHWPVEGEGAPRTMSPLTNLLRQEQYSSQEIDTFPRYRFIRQNSEIFAPFIPFHQYKDPEQR